MITRRDVEMAYQAIRGEIVRTPVVFSHKLSEVCGCTVLLKLENLQVTGSFKERGALNKLLSLSPEERSRGVLTASSGNHAQGVACHCLRLGIGAKIVMPHGTPLIKVVSAQRYRAEVILHGEDYDEAYERACEMAAQEGRTFIHPFEDPWVIAGQGTIAMELVAEPRCEGLDAVICPVGGGGLIAGLAVYLKEVAPAIRIIGVEAAVCPALKKSLEAGAPVLLERASSLADGIAVRRVGDLTFEIARKHVDEVALVEEDEIANAVLLLLELEKTVAEGAGATPVAALVSRRLRLEGKKVLAVVSGGNIDVNILSKIITRGLAVEGRIVELKVRLQDRPGALTGALLIVKRLQANILEIGHHRFDFSAPFGYVDVSITLETRGHEHIREIERTLREAGYLV